MVKRVHYELSSDIDNLYRSSNKTELSLTRNNIYKRQKCVKNSTH